MPDINANQVSTQVDENYMSMGAHIDQSLRNKIANFEYVDFARLSPKDRVLVQEDNRFKIVSRDGSTYFVPASDREGSQISSYAKWEQAFRVYSNVVTAVIPQKATELLQYNHVIHSASLSFTWDNVYTYNKEFRMHIANFPNRSWAIILQQAWRMCLKDRLDKS